MHGRSLFHVGKEIVVVAAFVVKECYGLAAKLHCRSLECEHAEARNKVSRSICIRPMEALIGVYESEAKCHRRAPPRSGRSPALLMALVNSRSPSIKSIKIIGRKDARSSLRAMPSEGSNENICGSESVLQFGPSVESAYVHINGSHESAARRRGCRTEKAQ